MMNTQQTQIITISEDTSVSLKTNKDNSSCCKGIFSVFKCLFSCFFHLITFLGSCIAGLAIGSVFAALITAITMSFNIVIAIASLPLLLVSFLITRILQFLKHGDEYDSAVHLKLFIRAWIYTGMSSLVIVLAIFYGIAKNNPNLKHVMFRGATLPNWIVIYFVIFGIYVFNWVLSVLTYKFIPTVPLNHSESGLNVPENVLEIIDCLVFWLALSEILKRVPNLKNDKILGLNTYKWIEVAIFVLIAYNIIVLCTRLVVRVLKSVGGKLNSGSNKRSRRYLFMEKMMHLRYVLYCANGIKHNIDFILISVLLLLTWVLYFGSRLNDTPRTKNVVDIVTRTCVSILVCSFLWLIKSCLLLSWEVRAVYNRLESKIVEGAKQLYFLGIIGRHVHDIFYLRYDCTTDPETEAFMCFFFNVFPIGVINIDSKYHSSSDILDGWEEGEEYGSGDGSSNDGLSSFEKKKKLSDKRKDLVNGDLLLRVGRNPSLYGVQQAAHHFLQARETLKNGNYTSDILDKFKSLTTSSNHQNSHNNGIIKIKLKQLIEACGNKSNNSDDETEENHDWECFEDQIREYVTSTTEISLEELDKWMERARNHCLFLANTLASAKEAVACLNNIISWLLIVVTFILWLLLTGLATTQVLVLIASPLLAATFIFGDTCKALFQGIIFAYVVHPLDVGDLCVIDKIMMEVRTIGVWITTFSKIGTLEEVIYPNSELSTKNFINHKTNFDWNDHIELEVPSLDDKILKELKEDIERYFNDNKANVAASFVTVLRTGCDTKIFARFRHNVEMKNSTYFRCEKEKHKRQSEIGDYLHELVNQKKRLGENSATNH